MEYHFKSSNRIERAIQLANFAFHAVGKYRKYTGEPYIVHCKAVARRLEQCGCKEPVIIAGVLHDVLEDTKVPKAVIASIFGDQVAQLVWEVTDVSRKEDGNRAARKAIDAQHLAKASPDGKDIKLADVIDNCWDIVSHDEDFAHVYVRECKLLLPYLEGCTTRGLWDAASTIINAAADLLAEEKARKAANKSLANN